MEQYPVPQFIEEKARIALFLTFTQFIYIVVAGGILLVLHAILPFFLFILSAIVISAIVLVFGFAKINGTPVLTVTLNSIGFITGTRSYTWRKKESLYPFITIRKAEIKKIEENKTLKLEQKSNLKKLRTKIDQHTK